jgi:AcrR family transcriptional regulator
VRLRRDPKQRRAKQTVEAVHGVEAITTNRAAEAADVSIGSLDQYSPDTQAIFVALHDRHVDRERLAIEQTSSECAAAPLPRSFSGSPRCTRTRPTQHRQ